MYAEPSPPRLSRYLCLLVIIWLIGVGLDRTWLRLDHGVPDMASVRHLNQMRAIVVDAQPWKGLVNPLVYAAGGLSRRLFGPSFDQVVWCQTGWLALLLAAVYGLGARLFSRSVGLWAAGFVVLLPVLLRTRLGFGIELPLVTLVLVSWWRLLVWQQAGRSHWPPLPSAILAPVPERLPWDKELQLLRQTISRRTAMHKSQRWWRWWQALRDWRARYFTLPSVPQRWRSVADALGLGVAMGSALLVHPVALIYLVVPLVGAGLAQIWQRQWWRSCQWLMAAVLAWTMAWPWYRWNLSSLVLQGLRQPLAPAALWRWDGVGLSQSLGLLATQLFYPLLLVGVVGLLLYQQRVARMVTTVRQSVTSAAMRCWRRSVRRIWWRSVLWLLVCAIVPLGLSATVLPLDQRLLLPVIPMLVILLTQGLLLFPAGFFQIRWLLLLLMIVWSVSNLLPLVPLRAPQQLAQPRQNWHQEALLQVVHQADPQQQATIGVVAQTRHYNAAYLHYLARDRDLPLQATTVGQVEQQVWQDRRSLPWYVLLSGDESLMARSVRQDPALRLSQTWKLPNNQTIQLFQRQQPLVQVTPIVGAQWSETLPVALQKITVPEQVVAGQPMPVTYTWAGLPQELQRGLVQLTWRRVNEGKSTATLDWWHDHAIGLGQVVATDTKVELMQVTERLAMSVPAGAVGRYRLEAQYFDPTQDVLYPLDVPDVVVNVGTVAKPQLQPDAVPELDLATQLRGVSRSLLQSPNFARWQQVVGRLDRYDPAHVTLAPLRALTVKRLVNDAKNPDLYADLALVAFLQRDMIAADAALQRLAQLQPQSYLPLLYRAIVQAARGQGDAAQTALDQAQQLHPSLVVSDQLRTLIAAVRGHPLAQWRLYRLRLDLMLLP